eukprot:CAMPEP_0176343990 /NCGR_PEP_ID=MMETSP0126-20121128/4356_1 /TAXON_ID=141414 ORGANISM="Strombidinopsis acuminatum, Strain SPMC142" /NCGR_SAMPLE_ID=MMETSP0126 /ASSEMBLY_ACC=CAM_ASM_000229 /LENGTH=151 /DNA_ID=CAMNT_0017690211 /DNA_START=1331 /DNA_END=1786 /DNA_ORIENTATION=+
MIYLTIKKFRRLNKQAETYEKLRKLEKNYEIELNPEMFTEMQALKVEINMLKNHSDEQAMATFNALKQRNQPSTSMFVKGGARPVTVNLVKREKPNAQTPVGNKSNNFILDDLNKDLKNVSEAEETDNATESKQEENSNMRMSISNASRGD